MRYRFRSQMSDFDEQIAAIPYVEASIQDSDLFGSALSIALQLFPEWKNSCDLLKISRCTEGITNKLIKIHNSAAEKTILLRCYGHGTSVIIDRRKELISLINLARLQMAPPLYGRFRNGFCYGFVPGQVLSPDQLSDNHIFKLIARKLARWHRIQMPTESSDGQNQPNAWKTIRNWLDQVPVRYSDKIVHQKYLKNYERLNVERLRGDLDSLQGILEQQTESPIVFCHNDLLSANIIYQHSLMMNDGLARIDDADNLPDSSTLNISTEAIDSSSKSFGKSSPLSARVSDTSAADSEDVVFIDYEYGAYMNRGFDIGNHFNEYAGFDCDYSKYPASKHQLKWLEIYLTEWNGGRRPSGQEINEIYREVNKFALVSHFFWAVWAMVQASVSDIEFDYLGYAILRFAEYDRRREEFLAL